MEGINRVFLMFSLIFLVILSMKIRLLQNYLCFVEIFKRDLFLYALVYLPNLLGEIFKEVKMFVFSCLTTSVSKFFS